METLLAPASVTGGACPEAPSGASDAPALLGKRKMRDADDQVAPLGEAPTKRVRLDAGGQADLPPCPPPAVELELDRLNPHPRDKLIRFEAEPNHKYYLYAREADALDADAALAAGRPSSEAKLSLPRFEFPCSVTGYVHRWFKPYDESGALAGVRRSLKPHNVAMRDWSDDQIRAKWAADRDEAAEQGRIMHKHIEDYYNGRPVSAEAAEYRATRREWMLFLEFDAWRRDQGLEPYRTEWSIWLNGLPGQPDMIFRRRSDGALFVFDWKRYKELKMPSGYAGTVDDAPECIRHLSDCNFNHAMLQTNAYQHILQTEYGLRIAGRSMVVLHPNNEHFVCEPLPDYQKETRECIELHALEQLDKALSAA